MKESLGCIPTSHSLFSSVTVHCLIQKWWTMEHLPTNTSNDALWTESISRIVLQGVTKRPSNFTSPILTLLLTLLLSSLNSDSLTTTFALPAYRFGYFSFKYSYCSSSLVSDKLYLWSAIASNTWYLTDLNFSRILYSCHVYFPQIHSLLPCYSWAWAGRADTSWVSAWNKRVGSGTRQIFNAL